MSDVYATLFVERLPRFGKDEQSLGGVAQSLCQRCAQKQAQHLDFDLCSKGRASASEVQQAQIAAGQIVQK